MAGIALLAGLGFLVGGARSIPPQPASSSIERNSLIVFDGQGRELWRKAFPYSLAARGIGKFPYTWIGDLDGDGHQEVLFSPHPENGLYAQESTPLICYSDRGEERWSYANTRTVRTADEEFSPVYAIARFIVTPLRDGGPNFVVAASTHTFYYPSQIALLTADGKLDHEYWHSGQLNRLEAADLDHDGLRLGRTNAAASSAFYAGALMAC